MAILNSWQRIDRVISGKPFGDGVTGSATVSSDPNTRTTITGTADSTSMTAGTTVLTNGDLLFLHQSRGTSVGQWEINQVSSGGGSTSIVLVTPLKYTYQSPAQVVVIPRYTSATLSSFNFAAWDASKSGIGVIAANEVLTIGGTVTINNYGYLGASSPPTSSSQSGKQGEGTAGARDTISTSANGNGGGGGQVATGGWRYQSGGGGGGYVSAGTNGQNGNGETSGSVSGGTGGNSVGTSDLSTILFGGGGGSGSDNNNIDVAGAGGEGGGIMVLFCKTFTYSSGSLAVNGEDGGSTPNPGIDGGGGGGAGGSILVVCGTGSFDTNKMTANYGAGGNGYGDGGAGSLGRIAVHHAGTITGSTSTPSFTDVTDTSLIEFSTKLFMFN